MWNPLLILQLGARFSSMRKAQIDKAWSDCRHPVKRRLDVSSLVVTRRETSQAITIVSRVNALLGENGAGKSTLLSCLANLSEADQFGNLYTGSSVSFKYNNNSLTLPKPEGATGNNTLVYPTFEAIDTSRDAHTSVHYLKAQQNLAGYLLQSEFKHIDSNGILEFNAVTGRSYAEIKIKEIESPQDPDDYLPYFWVKLSDGTEYDSLGMGFGELCTFILIWRINRCKNGQAILLDEPDSHPSPNSRRRMADFFAIKAAKMDLWIVFSTHSIESIESMIESELLLLARIDENPSSPISIGQDKNEAFLRLGLSLSKRFLIIVEDVDSSELLSQILQKFQPIIAQTCEIIPLVVRPIKNGAYQATPRSNLFQRNTTGDALISAMPFRMRCFRSSLDATRMCRKKVRAILEKAHSIKLSQEPCFGV